MKLNIKGTEYSCYDKGFDTKKVSNLFYEELIEDVDKFKQKVRSEFTVDDISFLVKTGRVSKVFAKIANILRIKVMLRGSEESTIVSTGKVPGRKLSIKKLVSQCVQYIRNLITR